MTEKDTEQLVPTLDGKRTRVDELNLGDTPTGGDNGRQGGLRGLLQRLNQVLAGMYTGLNCYGTPHSHRRLRDETEEGADKPDRRPL